MLSVEGVKGTLDPGADADLVVLSEQVEEDGTGRVTTKVVVDEVWKFAQKVYARGVRL